MTQASTPDPLAPGTAVRLIESLAYLKTADAMPMLRPPDLVEAGERGEVVAIRPLDQLAVRFRRGTFLLQRRQVEPLEPGFNG